MRRQGAAIGKMFRFFQAAAFLISTLVPSGIASAQSGPVMPPTLGRGQWLVHKLEEIADSDQALERNYLENALNIHLSGEVRPFDSSSCKFSYETVSGQHSHLTAEDSWYFPTPEGIQNMEVPSFTINSKSVQGKPAISYSSTISKNCTGWEDVLSKSETTLKFSALSSFACLTLDDMSKTLPEFKFVAATDGVAFFSYRGKETAGQGKSITINYRVGAKCMLSAKITQSTESGSTYAKAYSNFWNCSRRIFDVYWTDVLKRPLPQYTEFQKTAPAMYSVLLDSEEDREIFRKYAVKWCGSFDSIFQKYAEEK